MGLIYQDKSVALRGLLGYLADHPRFVLTPIQVNGQFDNGKTRAILATNVHNTGDQAADDVQLADLDGDVWIFSGAGAQELVRCSAPGRAAVDAFRKLLGPASFVVV